MTWRRALTELRFELFVAGVTAVAVLFLRAHGLKMDARTVDYIADATFHRWPTVLLFGFALQLVGCLVLWRSPLGWLRSFAAPLSLLTFARVWLGLMVMTYAYLWLKISVPLVNPALWDAELWALDRILHLGVSPSLFVVELFRGSRFVPWLDSWYSLWLTTIFATQAYLFFDADRRKRVNFAFACALLWLAAAWIYVALPAVGPCFFVREVFDPVREAMPGAAALQGKLWDNYLQMIAGRDGGALIRFKPFFAVAALPSVHVGAHFMFMLWARRHARRLWPLFAVATLLTFVGSLLTGWHYAVDGYLGMLLGWIAARLADQWTPVAAPPAAVEATPAARNAASDRAIQVAVGLLLAVYSVFGVERWRSSNPFDYYHFWVVGQSIESGDVDDIYSEEARRAVAAEFRARAERSGSPRELAGARARETLEPTGTPWLYAAIDLASTGTYEVDARRFQAVSWFGFVVAVVALAVGLGYPAWTWPLLLFASTQLYWPFHTDAAFGNVGRLQLLGLATASGLIGLGSTLGVVAGGAVLGLLLAFKPTVTYAVALLAWLWLCERRWRQLLHLGSGFAAGLAVAVATPILRFGAACSWASWRTEFPSIMFTESYLGGGFLGKLAGVRSLPLFTLFGLALFAAFAACVARSAGSGTPAGASAAGSGRDALSMIALGLAVYLLSGPIVHSHYFVLALPLALLALAPGGSAGRYALAGFAFLLTAAHPWILKAGLTAAGNHSLWSFLGVWILAAMVLREYALRRRADTAPVSAESAAAGRPD